ncbi:MAG: GntR family transcriptional regulator [Cyclobacteriaceae bacterium]|nr:GntR family transcriptional regulator [Cyclobacteriaceae bacterium]MCK5210121.1 GntR family transcriptional regulator [Cyclobacteriaceae bacterium]MCK5277858.1 GntR family transcriptional regulator [Cyclobacteriaceae bacterium]MCK5368524.1 GntR family transcriptional regulator [Cyclobacteriaceae bacterium]MCK5471438.1 GntR family transcriptional regulator [Cyclobacteriaceae bacterium]
MAQTRYRQIYNILKSRIQQGTYAIGDYLPSENELCKTYKITRTTARKALDELLKEGFIEKQHGKGSKVKERRQSLGLLTVKGFSEAVGENVRTIILQKPQILSWPKELPFPADENELNAPCIYFERLRCVGDVPVMTESNWFSAHGLNRFLDCEFVDGSFFKTLSRKYLIEVTGSEQELRALFADEKSAYLLKIEQGFPILRISIKFTTSKPDLNIYSYLYCNTEKYPIGNIYTH